MTSKDEMSPLDGWISFRPGEGISLNAQMQEMWIDSARRFRKMRGDILSSCFGLENVLDEIIGEVFFPGLSGTPSDSSPVRDAVIGTVLKSAFVRIFLRASANTFGRKVSLFKNAAKEIRQLGDLLTGELAADLETVVQLRNAFAHCPITFECRPSQSGQSFAALLLISGSIVELTEPNCQKHKALVSETAGLLGAVLAKLRTEPNRAGESPLSKDGIIWLGHVALSDDQWRIADPKHPLNTADYWMIGSKTGLQVNVRWNGDAEQDGEA